MVRVALLLAQLIQPKTLPLAQGNQFQIFPSANVGMGSVGIALSDSTLDAFLNPATGARLQESRLFTSPVVYSVTQGTGGGRSLPLALLARRADWYGGLALAVQQVDPSRPPEFNGPIALDGPPQPLRGQPDPIVPPPQEQFIQPDARAHGNSFAFAMLGRSLPGRHLSVGASVLWNGLRAVDGVDLLYAGSRRISQTGHALDMRLGAIKEWPKEEGVRSLEALLVHNRFSARHDVLYADLIWDPNTQQFQEQARTKNNVDETNTWGFQLNYRMPLRAPGWRIGLLVTANRASHPHIPEYELGNVPVIPRDPGYTHAFNFGLGFAKVDGPGRFGVDLVYEPISSYTWADAAEPTLDANGNTIPAGGKTIENRYRFSNAWLRVGMEQPFAPGKPTKIQLGLILHPIQYWLAQTDNVQRVSRNLSSGWVEWTPTWGVSYRQPEFEIRYQGRVTKGAGRPSGFQQFIGGFGDTRLAGATILAAPSGPVSMTDVSTVTHQISVSLPLR